ncbi:10 kDa heat shock protein, mitochondrial [Strongyloides ratti]|uniref:10 kDa heat shock protein, mitochondrial n=1 Tax=Strongyloides ratti TaxID=34506 RepID=A0A090L8X1_STRRB|nr:10 kDa heat shock protein, mitochondrial [Strongyloides ratti]CEF66186.1 10 kDa heat shock protein, mitochondrial [Strongyloides ratti]
MLLSAVRRCSSALKNVQPLFDRVMIKKAAAEVKSKGGIYIPEKAQGKVLEGTVVAAGPGLRTEDGKLIPLSVSVGDRVMLPDQISSPNSLTKEYIKVLYSCCVVCGDMVGGRLIQ